MRGSGQVRFSELFADTVKAHGVIWAHGYYCRKQGMAEWEFNFWLKVTQSMSLQAFDML
jgi:hypothetical protein